MKYQHIKLVQCMIVVSLVFLCTVFCQAIEKPGTVMLTLEQFDALRESAKKAVLPFTHIISNSEYNARVEKDQLLVHAKIDITPFTDQLVGVPLFKSGVILDKATISEKPANLTANKEGEISLALLGNIGEPVSLEIDFHTDVEIKEGFYRTSFNIPISGVANLTVDFPYDEVQAHLNGEFRSASTDSKGHSILKSSIGGSEQIQLKWLPLPKDVEPKISSTQAIFIEHLPYSIFYFVKFDLNVRQRPISELSVKLEKGLNVSGVKGEGVANFRFENDILKVIFGKPVFGNMNIDISVTKPVTDSMKSFTVPHFLPQGASGFNGYIAFASSDEYKLIINKQLYTNTVAINEFPDSSKRNYISKVFHFQRDDYDLNYTIEKIEPEFTAAVYSKVTFGETTCVITSRCEPIVRQSRIHSFKLSVPEGFRTEWVEGKDVQDWSLLPETNDINVELKHGIKEKTVFTAVFRRNYSVDQEIPTKLPVIYDSKRIRGFVAVLPNAAIVVSATEPSNLEELNITEVPLSMELETQPKFAYSYLEQPASIVLRTERLVMASMENSIIEKMGVVLTFSKHGEVKTDLTMEVRNNDFDSLVVQVGSKAAVRKAQVNGFDISPAIGENEDSLLIPVPKSKGKSSNISLSYLTKDVALEKDLKLKVPMPLVFLPIDEIGLFIILPEGYEAELHKNDIFEKALTPMKLQSQYYSDKMAWYQGPEGFSDGKVPDEVRKIATAMETYYVDNNAYPGSLDNLTKHVPYLGRGDYERVKGKYQLETDHSRSYRIGYMSQVPGKSEEVTVGGEGGYYYKASLLRGDKERMKKLLEVWINIDKKGWLF